MRRRAAGMLAALAMPVAAYAQQAVQFDIAAQPLASALRAFSQQSRHQVLFDQQTVAGRTAPALRGSYTPRQALDRLLAGMNLTVIDAQPGAFTLKAGDAPALAPAADGSTLPQVTVSADAEEGSAQSGYVARSVSQVGPWQGRALQDTPYALSVVPAELIENVQAGTPDQIFRMIPTTQLSWPQSQNDTPYVFLRGFRGVASARNGLPPISIGHGTTTEDVERIEILTGLSGFLYGPGNVGGLVNYVSKRPTPERYNSVTLGYTGGRNFVAHGDFGGPIDAEGRFGYRINAVTQDGETGVNGFTLRKQFVSAAFDWRVTDRLLLQIDAARRDYHSQRQAYWSLASGAVRPPAGMLDPKRLWSQPWTFYDVESERLGLNARWEVSDALTLRAAYLDRRDVRTYAFSENAIQRNWTYSQTTFIAAPQRFQGPAWHAFADLQFKTGPVAHKLTVGHLATRFTRYDHLDGSDSSGPFTGFTLHAPTHVPQPLWRPHGLQASWNSSINKQASWMIGDDITFNDRWSMLVGVTRATITSRTRSSLEVPWRTAYKDSATTPTVSLIYKPAPALTTYATYMEALEQGGTANDEYNGYPVANAGQTMAPLMSKQVEVGVKAEVGGMLLTGALFQIDKGLQYYDASTPTRPVYVQDGRQLHRGLEFTATGRLTSNLTLVGGLTLLDASVREQKQNPALEGKRPEETAKRMAKLYGEYRVPGVPGLTLNGGISYTGSSWGDTMNTDRLPGYTLLDAGVRYVMNAGSHPLTLRLNVNNLANKRYWVNRQFLGDARTVALSANLKF